MSKLNSLLLPDDRIADGPLRVYLVGRLNARMETVRVFLQDNDLPAAAMYASPVVTAGRLCYMSFSNPREGGDAAYVKRLLEMGHGSVLEHLVYSFIITGVSRSLTHELVRHRAGWSYSQRSQRYVDESTAQFILPPALDQYIESDRAGDNPPRGNMLQSTISNIIDDSRGEYTVLVSYLFDRIREKHPKMSETDARKEARGAARCVLPNGVETMIYCTVNARALRHFIELRASAAADAEIRRLAVALWRLGKSHDPDVFSDYTESPSPDGIGSVLDTPYRKV